MIKFDQVSKYYKDGTIAIQNLDLIIEPSEFVFLVGPSGAGKTTVIKLLIHEEVPTSGQIFLGDLEITGLPLRALPDLRRKIGVVFQDFKLLPSKTVYENVAVSLEVVDRPESEIRQVVPNVLNLVNLTSRINSFPNQLSGGEKQRLAIARALAHEPKVLVADEPTGNIDPVASGEVMSILNRINSLGTTVIMATHDVDVVNKMRKRVIAIEDGKLVKDQKESTYEYK